MNTFYLFLVGLFLLIGTTACNEADQSEQNKRFCHQMGSMTTVKITLKTLAPLPPNIALEINGSGVVADECQTNTSQFDDSVQISTTRTEAEVFFIVDKHSNIMDHYFPDGIGTQPQSDSMGLDLYSRNDCRDQPTKIGSIESVQLNWAPIYANGESCGTTSYNSESLINFE